MSGAEEFLSSHGLTVFKGLAVAGVGGAIISKLLMSNNSSSPAAEGKKVFGRPGPVFTSLALQSSENVNQNVKRLRFALPNGKDVSGLPLTSALLTCHIPQGSYLPVLRPYTPVSPSDQAGTVDFLIKRYPNGKASTHMHSLSPGDKLLFAVVIPGYKWTANKHDSVTLVAGGAGITPCYQLLRGILQNPVDKTRVRLVFGVNSMAEALLRDEFEQMEQTYGTDRFRAVFAVADGEGVEEAESASGGMFRKGFVTEDMLKQVAAPASEANTKIMVCGPPPMEDALLGKKGWGGRGEGILARLGYKKEQIHQF
ncbi:hypothetical protein BD289DRAFT_457169 [Coniella lustricola]|uniref:FAD-binding FR-type domain-containing protein n=1 Tax=Coniella lustricola TaxID=2025994 RepID=A0A2T2ZSX5_9PEZI|nr:hypothetical protein BD289DRAFT_457169 [Coniella lustricola]